MTKHSLSNKKWNERHPGYHAKYGREHRRIDHMNHNRAKSYNNKYRLTHPVCEICGAKTQEIHHIIPLPKDRVLEIGDALFHEDNLMALCKKCHDKAHNEK